MIFKKTKEKGTQDPQLKVRNSLTSNESKTVNKREYSKL